MFCLWLAVAKAAQELADLLQTRTFSINVAFLLHFDSRSLPVPATLFTLVARSNGKLKDILTAK